jgi:hypothetical protein
MQDLVAMMRRTVLLLTLLLAAAAVPLPAQEAVQVPPTLYLFTSGPGPDAREERLLAELVFLHLRRELAVRLVEGELGAAVPEEDAEKTRRAAAAGADAWLELRASRQGESLSLSYRLYLLAEEALAAEERLTAPGPVSALPEDFWRTLSAAASAALPQRLQQVEVATRVVETREIRTLPYEVGTRVTVRARPGTRISGLTPQPLYVDAGGTAVAEVAPRATYRLQAEHWRYLPEVRKIYIGTSPETVELEQKQGTRFAVEGLTHTKESLGTGLRYYPLPGILFAGLRVINSFQGLLPPYDFQNDDDRWFSRNLYIGFNVGAYLNRQSRSLRLGLAAGGFVRFYSGRNDTGFELHPVFPYGLTLGPVFELSAGRRFALVGEWMPELYIYIPFDETLTQPGGPYEYMQPYPWDDIGSGGGNLRFNMESAFFGVRYRF